jgi:hypothetical protein
LSGFFWGGVSTGTHLRQAAVGRGIADLVHHAVGHVLDLRGDPGHPQLALLLRLGPHSALPSHCLSLLMHSAVEAVGLYLIHTEQNSDSHSWPRLTPRPREDCRGLSPLNVCLTPCWQICVVPRLCTTSRTCVYVVVCFCLRER